MFSCWRSGECGQVETEKDADEGGCFPGTEGYTTPQEGKTVRSDET